MLEGAFSRPSVLALQTNEFGQPVFDLLESCRRKLQLVGEVPKRKREVFQQRARSLQPFKILTKLRFVAGQLLDPAGRLTKASYRRITVFVCQAEAFRAKGGKLLDVIEPTPFLFELLVLTDYQPRALKLINLKPKDVDHL